MMYDSPFRYFADPHNFAYYVVDQKECSICKRMDAGYEAGFFGPDISEKLSHVCETCMKNGRIAEFEAVSHSVSKRTLRAMSHTMHPEWSVEQIEAYVTERTLEIETRTPAMVKWQDYDWPAHCDDYMRYIKGIGKADCEALSESRYGKGFLTRHLSDSFVPAEPQRAAEYIDSLWASMRDDSPIDFSDSYWTEFYLFQCLNCGSYLIEWDMG